VSVNDLYPFVDDQDRRVPYNVYGDFHVVFDIDLDAWAPRSALYRQAVAAAESTGSRVPSPQQVYAALRLRGFPEAKRRGVWGFKGLRVGELAEVGRFVPSGTAAAYYRRGDRSEVAREAVFAARLRRVFERERARDAAAYGLPEERERVMGSRELSPWFEKPMTPEARARIASAGRRGPRRRRSPDA
jgi:hypothetical protein